MSTEFDDQIKALFDDTAATITQVPDGFDADVLAQGQARRRARRLQIAGGATVAALLVAVAAPHAPDLVNNGAKTPATDRPTATTTTNGFAPGAPLHPHQWVDSLPLGADATVAFIANGTLYVDGESVPISGGGPVREQNGWALYLGERVSTGWLFNAIDVADIDPDDPAIVSGVLGFDGTQTAFDAPAGLSGYAVASPDGTQAAAASVVYDVTSGDVVGQLPPGSFATAWTSAGIVYSRRVVEEPTLLWDPDGTSLDIDLAGGKVVDRYLVTSEGDCEQVAAINDDGSTSGIGQVCEPADILSISPDGRYAVTTELQLVDMRDGILVSVVPRTTDAWYASYPDLQTFAWEGGASFVFALTGADGDARASAGQGVVELVRCMTATGSCERAGEEIAVPDGEGTRNVYPDFEGPGF